MRNVSQRLDRDLICVLLLLTLGLVAYSNSFTASFHFDDAPQILLNDGIHALTHLDRIYAQHKARFLTYLTFAFNYRFSGSNPVGYHVVNFFIHYLAALLVYFLFLELWTTPGMQGKNLGVPRSLGAALAAGIFLLHPLQTQAVTYIIQRAESMAGMFYIATLLFYIKARSTPGRKVSPGYGVLAVAAATCAAFSKETAVTLPALVVVLELFFFNTPPRDLVRNKLVLVFLVPAGVVVAFKLKSLLERDFFYDPGIPFTRKEYFLTQLGVLSTYVRLFFWPANQNVDWDYPILTQFFSLRTFSSFLFLIALLVLALLAYRKFRLVSLGLVAFFITLAPTSSIIPIIDVLFEHRMYLPVAFLAMGSVQLLSCGFERIGELISRGQRPVQYTSVMAVLVVLAVLTHGRNEVWLTEISLWRDAAMKSPNKARAHNNYGQALYMLGRKMTEPARREFEIAKQLDPDWPLPYHNLAIGCFQAGDFQRAIAWDLQAIERQPKFAEALYQLGRSHTKLEEWEEARSYLERLIDQAPGPRFLPAYLCLMDTYFELGLEDKAAGVAERMINLPDYPSRIDYFRGMALYYLEDFAGAKKYFSRQTRRASASVSSYLMLGEIHYLDKEYEKAEEAFRQVLARQWWSAAAHYNLAVVHAENGRYREASNHFEKSLEIDSFSLGPRILLVGLYNHLGEGAKQLEHLRKLFGLSPVSDEFLFLQETAREQDLHGTLRLYEARFLSGNESQSAEKILAIIATLRENYREAIERYENYLEAVSNPVEEERIGKEVRRLKQTLRGVESLRTPA
jgi:tetratricopeptide (TPR) repeat protein